MQNTKKLISTLILIVILTHQPIYAQGLRSRLLASNEKGRKILKKGLLYQAIYIGLKNLQAKPNLVREISKAWIEVNRYHDPSWYNSIKNKTLSSLKNSYLSLDPNNGKYTDDNILVNDIWSLIFEHKLRDVEPDNELLKQGYSIIETNPELFSDFNRDGALTNLAGVVETVKKRLPVQRLLERLQIEDVSDLWKQDVVFKFLNDKRKRIALNKLLRAKDKGGLGEEHSALKAHLWNLKLQHAFGGQVNYVDFEELPRGHKGKIQYLKEQGHVVLRGRFKGSPALKLEEYGFLFNPDKYAHQEYEVEWEDGIPRMILFKKDGLTIAAEEFLPIIGIDEKGKRSVIRVHRGAIDSKEFQKYCTDPKYKKIVVLINSGLSNGGIQFAVTATGRFRLLTNPDERCELITYYPDTLFHKVFSLESEFSSPLGRVRNKEIRETVFGFYYLGKEKFNQLNVEHGIEGLKLNSSGNLFLAGKRRVEFGLKCADKEARVTEIQHFNGKSIVKEAEVLDEHGEVMAKKRLSAMFKLAKEAKTAFEKGNFINAFKEGGFVCMFDGSKASKSINKPRGLKSCLIIDLPVPESEILYWNIIDLKCHLPGLAGARIDVLVIDGEAKLLRLVEDKKNRPLLDKYGLPVIIDMQGDILEQFVEKIEFDFERQEEIVQSLFNKGMQYMKKGALSDAARRLKWAKKYWASPMDMELFFQISKVLKETNYKLSQIQMARRYRILTPEEYLDKAQFNLQKGSYRSAQRAINNVFEQLEFGEHIDETIIKDAQDLKYALELAIVEKIQELLEKAEIKLDISQLPRSALSSFKKAQVLLELTEGEYPILRERIEDGINAAEEEKNYLKRKKTMVSSTESPLKYILDDYKKPKKGLDIEKEARLIERIIKGDIEARDEFAEAHFWLIIEEVKKYTWVSDPDGYWGDRYFSDLLNDGIFKLYGIIGEWIGEYQEFTKYYNTLSYRGFVYDQDQSFREYLKAELNIKKTWKINYEPMLKGAVVMTDEEDDYIIDPALPLTEKLRGKKTKGHGEGLELLNTSIRRTAKAQKEKLERKIIGRINLFNSWLNQACYWGKRFGRIFDQLSTQRKIILWALWSQDPLKEEELDDTLETLAWILHLRTSVDNPVDYIQKEFDKARTQLSKEMDRRQKRDIRLLAPSTKEEKFEIMNEIMEEMLLEEIEKFDLGEQKKSRVYLEVCP
ncbi:MAG: hypothetical protein P9L93_00360 [Candidatus Gorgyraea atricola]|nr:hypothetical protein [Candidatus Gorgyraea atricola]